MSNSLTINVDTYSQTVTGFTANTTTGNAPQGVEFNVTTINDNATAWNWSFGDGSYQNSTQNASHIYTTGGNYTVTEIADNPFFTNTTIRLEYINISLYNTTVSGFVANTTEGIASQGILFNVTTINDNATAWNWSFGDGSTQNGTQQNVSHTYTIGGNFTISETAYNPSHSEYYNRLEYVNISLYNTTVSGFVANITDGIAPQGILFNVTTINDNATAWNWSFGDGSTQNGTSTECKSHLHYRWKLYYQ